MFHFCMITAQLPRSNHCASAEIFILLIHSTSEKDEHAQSKADQKQRPKWRFYVPETAISTCAYFTAAWCIRKVL